MKKFILFLIIGLLIFSLSYSHNVAKAREVKLNGTEFYQGDIISVTINNWNQNNLARENYKVHFSNNIVPLYLTDKGNLKTRIGISYWTKPGTKEIILKANEKVIFKQKVKIKSGNFEKSYIEVNKDKEKLVKPKQNSEIDKQKKKDQQKINKARQNTHDNNLEEGNYLWPLRGKISTSFGATRYVNGKLQSRHSGIDIAAPKGTPIKSTNTGIVVLTDNLIITGKTIIIDHGQGVFSSYSHLDEIIVNEGEKVNKGQKIGKVGSTGFSTGSHLHWAIKINGTFINPQLLLK